MAGASENDNKHSVAGTLYAKQIIPITGKKDPTQTYNKYILTIECTSTDERKRGDTTKFVSETNLIMFEVFNPKWDIDSYAIGDFVFVRFYIEGKEFTYQKGDKAGQKGLINRNVITYMKYADLDANRPNHKGKVTVTSMSDVRDLEMPPPPDPEANEPEDDLPF